MDLNFPPQRNPLSPREQRAHAQFAREISDQVDRTRAALGGDPFTKTGPALPGAVA